MNTPPRSLAPSACGGRRLSDRTTGSRVSTRRGLRPTKSRLKTSRDCAAKPTVRYNGLSARILAACDQARSLSGIASRVGDAETEHAIRSCLQVLIDYGHVVEIEGLYLALFVMRNRSVMVGECVRNDDILAHAPAPSELLLHSL